AAGARSRGDRRLSLCILRSRRSFPGARLSNGIAGSILAVAAALLLAMPGVGRSETADGIAGVAVDGTQFRVTLKSGRVLDSMALVGAVLNLDLRGGAARRIRIVDVRKDPDDPDGEVFLHSMMAADASGHWTALC